LPAGPEQATLVEVYRGSRVAVFEVAARRVCVAVGAGFCDRATVGARGVLETARASGVWPRLVCWKPSAEPVSPRALH
jgi:hypothetical protein